MVSKGHESLLRVPVPLAAKHSNNGTGFLRFSMVGIILHYGVHFPFLYHS